MPVVAHLAEKAMRVSASLRDAEFERELILISSGRMLQRLALGVFGIFVPVFFFEKFGDINTTIMYFAGIFGLYLVSVPIGAKLLARLGTKIMLIIATFSAFLSVLSLYIFQFNPTLSVLLYAITISLYRTFYWIPYNFDLSIGLGENKRDSRFVSFLNYEAISLALAPLIGGFVIARYGFDTSFLLSMFFLILSIFPTLFIHQQYERFSWGYTQTWKKLFNPLFSKLTVAHFANGVQGVVLLIFWPLYLFAVSGFQYSGLGFIVSFSLLFVFVVRFATGFVLRNMEVSHSKKLGIGFSASGWFLKLFAFTPFTALVADSIHRLGDSFNSAKCESSNEQFSDSGKFVDEYTALKEMALNLGRISMLLVMFILVQYVDIKFAFLISGVIMTLFLFWGKYKA